VYDSMPAWTHGLIPRRRLGVLLAGGLELPGTPVFPAGSQSHIVI